MTLGSNGLYVENTVNDRTTAHAYCTLRTSGSGGGNPCLSFDVAGVAGWSMFCDNADLDSLKMTSSWAMVGGNTFFHMRRDNNTINCGQNVFFLPRTIVSACARGSTGAWTSGTALIGSYLQSSIFINYTLNSAVNGIRPSGYVAPIGGIYQMNFTARFQDNNGLASFMARMNGGNLLSSDFWVPNDGSGRRCVSYSHMVQMASGDAYDIFSTNGNNIIWGEFSARLVTTFGI